MADRDIPTLYADNPIDPTTGTTYIPGSKSGTAGAFTAADLLAAAPAAHAASHASGGSDALSGCGLACSYSPTNYTPSAATIEGQFTGINTKLGTLGAQAVSVDADGTLDAPSGTEVGSQLDITVNKAAGDYVAERTNVVETAAPGTANKLKEWRVGGTPKVSVMSTGAVVAHNPGTDAAPALQPDRGSGNPVGITNPADNQLGLVANAKKLIVDNSGANPILKPDATLTWDVGDATHLIRRAFISTLVDPLIAAVADPVNQAVSFVLSSLTAAKTITMPNANVDLTYVQQASATARGTAELADTTEAKALTDTARVITPATLGAVLADASALSASPLRHVRIIGNPNHNNVTLASGLADASSFDGQTLATGDVVVLTNQTTASENGPWVVAASGAPSRPAWFATGAGAAGAAFVALDGYAAGRVARVTNDRDADTIDTHNLTVRFDTKVHRGAAAPTLSDDYSTGCFPGDLWIWENVDESHAYIDAGEDAASPVWRQLDTGGAQSSSTTSSWTLATADANNTYYLSDGTQVALTINTGLPDMIVTFVQAGAGPIKANAGTATRHGAASFDQGSNVFQTAEQYSEMTVKIRGGVAYISGDLAAAP